MKKFLLFTFSIFISLNIQAQVCKEGQSCSYSQDDNSSAKSSSKRINVTLDSSSIIGKYTVSAKILNIRESPYLKAQILGQLNYGDEILVLSSKGDWKMIKLKNKYGWVSSKFVELSH